MARLVTIADPQFSADTPWGGWIWRRVAEFLRIRERLRASRAPTGSG